MPANKIVVHKKNGNILKGATADFRPERPLFHIVVGGIHGEKVKKVFMDNLKAIFFVKDFGGNKNYNEMKGFNEHLGAAKKIRVIFQDGEIISGYTHALNLNQPGFFLNPADPKSNNERIFVIFSALSKLEVDDSSVELTS